MRNPSTRRNFSRRTAMAMGASALTIGGIGIGSRTASATSALGVDTRRLPSAAELEREVRKMVALGPRLPGTSAHNTFVNKLAAGFNRAGLSVQRDTHHFTRWLAEDFGLAVLDGPEAGELPVASYYTYSGKTPREGVIGELAYLGPVPTPSLTGNLTDADTVAHAVEQFAQQLPDAVRALIAAVPGGVEGKVVVMDAPILPVPLGLLYLDATYVHDPDGSMSPTHDYQRAWSTLLTIPVLSPFREAGAAGVVFILDASPENAKGQYTPFIHGYQDLPALIVDRAVGARLRTAAADAAPARLTLRASLTPNVGSDSLVATLPGKGATDEVMIVHTHTDGQNAVEENGGIALVALARYFARAPLNRTLVFSCVTGHFAAELPETHGFIEDHPDLIERAAAQVTIEHLGSTEWLDNSRGYYPTGLVEPAPIFHSMTPIAGVGVESVRAVNLQRTLLMRPVGPIFFGVGAGLHAAGVPSLAYIAGPHYTLALDGKRGHFDKFDADRMRAETAWAADTLQRLDQVPAAVLRAGDSELYRGVPLPGIPPE